MLGLDDEIPEPPAYLHPGAAELWRVVLRDYSLEPFQLSLLETACSAKSQELRCQEILDAEGMTFTSGRNNMIRARPECTLLRDSRSAFLRAMAALRLEVE